MTNRRPSCRASWRSSERWDIRPSVGRYNFCTNGSHYAGEARIPTVGLGPSRENLAHTIDEYIELTELFGAADCYYGVLKALLTEKTPG